MSRVLVVALSAMLFAAITGCGRHVVVEPETAARANDRAWKVTSEPGRTVVIEGNSAATPAATPALAPARPAQ